MATVHRLVRWTAVLVTVIFTGVAPALAATPSPTPSPSAGAFQQEGVSVTPVPHDQYASKSGTHLEMGLVTPGHAIHDKVRVLNIGPKPLSVDLYAADAIPAVNGGFGFTAKSDTPTQVGSWIHLPVSHLDLPGNSTTTVQFVLLVPAGVTGGEHVGAIVAEPSTPTDNGGVSTKTRFAMAVYLRTPGTPPVQQNPQTVVTVTKLHVGTSGRTVCPTLAYTNHTPDVIDPSLTMTLDSSLGLGSKKLVIPHLGGILPGSNATAHLPCFTGVAPGPSELNIAVTSPQGVRSIQQEVGVYPWPLFLALLLLLILLLLVAREIYKRWKARQRELAELRALARGQSGSPGSPGTA